MYNATAAFVFYRVGRTQEAYEKIQLGMTQMSPTTSTNIGYWVSAAEIACASGDTAGALAYQRAYSH